jgi:2-haloacid dehalogenase
VHSAVGKYRQRLGDFADQVSLLWRTKQLEYTWLRSLMGHHADFWQVTRDALDFAFDMHHLNDTDLRNDLIEAYLHLDCYPEVPEALSTLKPVDLELQFYLTAHPPCLRQL